MCIFLFVPPDKQQQQVQPLPQDHQKTGTTCYLRSPWNGYCLTLEEDTGIIMVLPLGALTYLEVGLPGP